MLDGSVRWLIKLMGFRSVLAQAELCVTAEVNLHQSEKVAVSLAEWEPYRKSTARIMIRWSAISGQILRMKALLSFWTLKLMQR